MNSAAVGTTLIWIAAGLFAGILMALRVLPKIRLWREPQPASPIPMKIDEHQDAVLVVQRGGRVVYLNPNAREWFNAWEETPNLERLARRARPAETFLSLCASESQAHLTLAGRAVEAASYVTPYNGTTALLVTLRQARWRVETPGAPGADPGDGQAGRGDLAPLAELSRKMSASLHLEETLRAVLDVIDQFIPADACEVTLWEAESETLISYHFASSVEESAGLHLSVRSSTSRRLTRSAIPYRLGEGYSGHIAETRRPLRIDEVEDFQEARPSAAWRGPAFHSFAGAPMLAGDELVGTLEVAALPAKAFGREELDLLQAIAGHAATALRNARLYQAERSRAQELAGLATLAQAVTALTGTQDLFTHLTASIASLLKVEILGFLLYDEPGRRLVGQSPFIGIPDNLVEWCQAEIPPDSPAEKVWYSGETILAIEASADERLAALGLHHIATAAGMRSVVLAPLPWVGRRLGYLQAANKQDGTPFTPQDLHLIGIITAQAGPLLENASLVRQSQRRAQRAETLRRIASLTGSNATLDEILKYSLVDLARLMQVDLAAVLLLDEHRSELRMHGDSLFAGDLRDPAELSKKPEPAKRLALSREDPAFSATVTASQAVFSSGRLEEKPAPAYLRPVLSALKVEAIIAVPLVARDRGIGELVLGSRRADFFQPGDVQLASTVAGQLASAVEGSNLYAQTDPALRRRVDQLTALNRVGREINSTLDLEHILRRVYRELLSATHATCGAILLFDGGETEEGERRLLFTTGEDAGFKPGHLEQQVLQTGESLVVADYASAGQSPAHPGARSALIVPIASRGQAAGLILLHSPSSGFFGVAEREIVESLAIQSAIALENAYRYREQLQRSEQLNRRVETLSCLFETTRVMQAGEPVAPVLETIATAIQASTPFDMVLISVYDPRQESLLGAAEAGLPPQAREELFTRPQAWPPVRDLLQPEFCVGRAYFIPAERMPVIPPELHTVTVFDRQDETPGGENPWQAEDMLLLPLLDSNGQPLGLISVDSPRDGLRPDHAAIESLEIFGSQAAMVIEMDFRQQALHGRLEQLETSLQQARQAETNAGHRLADLEQKSRAVGSTFQELNRRAGRIQAGLDIAGIVHRQPERPAVLQALAGEMLARMGFDLVLVAEPGPGNSPRLVSQSGRLPEGANPEALLGQRNPLRHCLQTGAPLYVAQIQDNPEWQNTPLLNSLGAGAFVCLPLAVDERVDAVLLAASRTPLPPFTASDEQLFSLLSRQAAGALKNLSLAAGTQRRLREVSLLLEFSRQIGALDSASILNTLAQSALRAVPAAQAALAVLWDPRREVLEPQVALGYPHNEHLLEMVFQPGESLPGQVFASGEARRVDEVDFLQDYNLSSDNQLRYRDATAGRPPVSSLVIPIARSLETSAEPEANPAGKGTGALRNGQPHGVLVLDCFETPAAFSAEDQALISSLARQTALSLENAHLVQAAEQRARQMEALTGVAAAISSSLQPDELIDGLLDRLEQILPYDTGVLWLRSKGEEPGTGRMTVRAARGFADNEQRVGISTAVEDSQLLYEMIHSGQTISIPDVRRDPRFSALIEHRYLSWLGIPLISSGEVAGVIALEKTEQNYYTPEYLQAAATFAGQVAVALENASLYQDSLRRTEELDRQSQTLVMLNRLSTELSGSLDVDHIFDFSLRELHRALGCRSVCALDFDAAQRPVLQGEVPAVEGTSLPAHLPAAPLFDRLRQTLGIFHSAEIAGEAELEPLGEFLGRRAARALLALPLVTGSELHGLLLALGEDFQPDQIELARTISNQVAIAVQNARLFAETRSLTQDLEARVEQRTAELGREHQRAQTLLRIISELSASLDLEQVLSRTLVVLNEMVGAEQATVLILRSGEDRLYRIASVGYTRPAGVTGTWTPFNMNEGLAGWVIQNRQAAMIPDLSQDPRWVSRKTDSPDQHRSALATPLMVGPEALGCMLLFNRESGHFQPDQLELVQAVANQVAVAVNNAELFRLIRDQAEDLGSMLRKQQVETSRSKAILEAVADGVLVTDAQGKITLFNASAEAILGLSRGAVIGKPLEVFGGLFGKTGQPWQETIRAWSQDPTLYQAGNTYSEQLALENGAIVSVRLAPVILRNDFLGTVSIFTDISHQVEVDRLKSEFVATVSHELRTPMTSIKGYVEILLMGAGGPLNEQQTHFLQTVKTNTERLAVLVNDLLDISRIESGKVKLSLQPLDLRLLVQAAISDVQRRSQDDGKPVRIDLEIPDNLPPVFGDTERVRQILDNLLDNAYLYNYPSGRIGIRLQPQGQAVQVDVTDNGCGIPLKEQGRIFERFFRGEGPLELGVSGTGLGLSIVQNLVQMHHGEIWFHSSGNPGEGSTFSFTLPQYLP